MFRHFLKAWRHSGGGKVHGDQGQCNVFATALTTHLGRSLQPKALSLETHSGAPPKPVSAPPAISVPGEMKGSHSSPQVDTVHVLTHHLPLPVLGPYTNLTFSAAKVPKG